jgi:hypothetical protein
MKIGVVQSLRIIAALCLLAGFAGAASAQVDDQLTASRRLFPGVGPGLHALKRGPDDSYYVLTAPESAVSVFDAHGKLLKKIPDYGATSGPAAAELHRIQFGEDMDVDAAGTVYVADRGTNSVKVWESSGGARMMAVNSPVSVAALGDGEVAVATLREPHLVVVFDKNGRDVREFGEPEQLADRPDLNRFLSNGSLLSDKQGHLYYGFEYLPEPEVRQYDRNGYAGHEFQFIGLDAMPEARAIRREIDRQEKRGDPPLFHRVLTAFGVDPVTGEIWMALHNMLLHFDKDGNRRSTYQIYTPEGARLEASIILVENERLLIGSDPLGVYEFPRPDKKRP